MIRIEDCISFLAGKAYQRINRRARSLLQPLGVTPTQYALLSVLWERDGQSGSELAERLILDSAAMTGLIDRAEALDLITRVPDPDDKRISRVWLSPRGAALQGPLTRAIEQLNDEVRRQLGPGAASFHRSLRTIAAID